jgi:polysaccharide export outer membrane protein
MSDARGLLMLVALTALSTHGACAQDDFVWVDDLAPQEVARESYRIAPGDRLHVNIWNQQPLTGDHTVRPDGIVSMPLIGEVPVAGLSTTDAAAQITRRLEGLVLNPRVVVAVREGQSRFFSVLGEVRNAGRFPLEPGDGVLEAIARAGGLTEFARSDRIFVLRGANRDKRIRFRFVDLSRGIGRGAGFLLRDGDVVVVE